MEKKAKKILTEIFTLLDLPVQDLDIKTSIKDNCLNIYIEGEDIGNIIGYHGEVIYSLQSILYSYFGLNENNDLQIYLDIGGYRKKREEKLMEKVSEAIRIVRLQKRNYKFLPMRPSDRRLIHLEVSKYPDLVSYSIGEGLNRCVVISLSDLN